jgi:hypothetical protein
VDHSLDVIEFDDHTGQAEVAVVRVVGSTEVGVTNLIDVHPVLGHRLVSVADYRPATEATGARGRS